MKPKEPIGIYEKARRDIYAALATQPFPIRGWHLTLNKSEGQRGLYGVHSTAVPVDEDGIPVAGKTPPVLFELDAAKITLTADFRLEACKEIGGYPWECPEIAKGDQWLRFRNSNGTLELILDTKFVPPYQEQLFYPDRDTWMERVSFWAKRWNDSKRRDREARWVLIQLDGIRNSGNHILEQALKRLVSRIEHDLPDYWFFVEYALAGKLTDDEIKTLNEYEHGKGAITIRTTPRPQMEPSKSIQ